MFNFIVNKVERLFEKEDSIKNGENKDDEPVFDWFKLPWIVRKKVIQHSDIHTRYSIAQLSHLDDVLVRECSIFKMIKIYEFPRCGVWAEYSVRVILNDGEKDHHLHSVDLKPLWTNSDGIKCVKITQCDDLSDDYEWENFEETTEKLKYFSSGKNSQCSVTFCLKKYTPSDVVMKWLGMLKTRKIMFDCCIILLRLTDKEFLQIIPAELEGEVIINKLSSACIMEFLERWQIGEYAHCRKLYFQVFFALENLFKILTELLPLKYCRVPNEDESTWKFVLFQLKSPFTRAEIGIKKLSPGFLAVNFEVFE